MARSPQKRIYFYCLWGKLLSTCSNATKVASRSQATTDNGVRDGRSVNPTHYRAVRPERQSHGVNASIYHSCIQLIELCGNSKFYACG